MNTNNTTEFSELTHAGQCLDIYLNNTYEIYEQYTAPVVECITSLSAPSDCGLWETSDDLIEWESVKNAVKTAVSMVEKYDHLTPTAADIEQVTRNYADYIADCAKYELSNETAQ